MRQYWIRSQPLAACCLILAMNSCSDAQTHGPGKVPASMKLEPGKCTAITAKQRGWLGVEWQPIISYTKSCEVKGGNSVALYVIAVWADDYEAHLAKDAPAVKLPKPVIMSKDGKVLGHLPLGFPRDPPRSSEVTFSRWLDGFPGRIQVEVDDPTVTGNSTLWLEWDERSSSFVPSRTKQ
jgi:hypothetical protein